MCRRKREFCRLCCGEARAPADAHSKIENFIRTKYESKRWVMDGPMPDPASLNDADEDVVCVSIYRDKRERKENRKKKQKKETKKKDVG